MADLPNLTVVDHALVRHKVDLLRKRSTPPKIFAEVVEELTMLLTFAATRRLDLEEVEIETPMEPVRGMHLRGEEIAIVPILRAGLGMLHGVRRLIPTARVGHIGIYRDEDTLEPVDYYFNIPSRAVTREAVLLDPMLATGGSASAAVSYLKERGVHHVRFICIVAAPEGVEQLGESHPDVPVFAAALDRGLNEEGYIVPGLGDAGDRLFGTVEP